MSSIFFAVKNFQEYESETPRENPVFVKWVACENIRFSSLFAAGNVSRGGTSATQAQFRSRASAVIQELSSTKARQKHGV